jgi:hypothetical protein
VIGSLTPSEVSVVGSLTPSEVSVFGSLTPSEVSVIGSLTPSEISVIGSLTPSEVSVIGSLTPSEVSVVGSLTPSEVSVIGSLTPSEVSVVGSLTPSEISVVGSLTPSEISVVGSLTPSEVSVIGSLTPSEIAVVGSLTPSEIAVVGSLTPSEIAVVGSLTPSEISVIGSLTPSQIAVVGSLTPSEISVVGSLTPSEIAVVGSLTPAEIAVIGSLTPNQIGVIGSLTPAEIQAIGSLTPSEIAVIGSLTPSQVTVLGSLTPSEVSVIGSLTPSEVAVIGSLTPSEVAVIGSLTPSQVSVLGSLTPSEIAVIGSLTPSEIAVVGSLTPSQVSVLGSLTPSEVNVLGSLTPSEVSVLGSLTPSEVAVIGSLTPSEVAVLGSLTPTQTSVLGSLTPSEVAVIGSLTPSQIGVLGSLTPSQLAVLGSLTPSEVAVLGSLTPSQTAVLGSLTPSEVSVIGSLTPSEITVLGSLTPTQVAAIGSLTPAQLSVLGSLTPSEVAVLGSLTPTQVAVIGSLTPAEVSVLGSITPSEVAVLGSLTPSEVAVIGSLTPAEIAAISSVTPAEVAVINNLEQQNPALFSILFGQVTVNGGGTNARVGLLTHAVINGDKNTVQQSLTAADLNTVNTLNAKLNGNPAALALLASRVTFTGNGNVVSAGLLSNVNMGNGDSAFEQRLNPNEVNLINTLVGGAGTPAQAQTVANALGVNVVMGNGTDTVAGGALGNFQTGSGNDKFFVEDPTEMGVPASALTPALTQFGGTFSGGSGNNTYYFVGQQLGSVTVNQKNYAPAVNTLDLSAFRGDGVNGINLDLQKTAPQLLNPPAPAADQLTLTLTDAAGISNVVGTRYPDTILGNSRDNILMGGPQVEAPPANPAAPNFDPNRTQIVWLDFLNGAQSQSTTAWSMTHGAHLYTPTEENAILGNLQQIYQGFEIQFQLAQPQSGSYTTIYFNMTSASGMPGGVSNEIDWRNTNLNDQAEVDINGFMGDTGQPEDTSANAIGISTEIAAHEFGHTLGFRHGDAFAPIGSGIHNPPGPGAYVPSYPGPVDAFETTQQVINTPFSEGSTLFDLIGSHYLGERELAKLAFAQESYLGTNLFNETDAALAPVLTPIGANSYSVHPLGQLTPLYVPNTEPRGFYAGYQYDVGAKDVLGSMTAGTSDYYSFSAQAGQLINISVISNILTRIANPVTSNLLVYDSSGNLIALNTQEFENTGDTTIIDLTAPKTGTYYVQVKDVDSGTQTEQYELFLYRFAAYLPVGASAANDMLSGRGGNNTLIGGSGNNNTVQESGAATYTLTNSILTSTTGTDTLQNISNAALTGSPSGTTFNVGSWTGTGALIGAGGVNSVIASVNASKFVLTDSSLSVTSGGTFNLTDIQNAVLTGAPSGTTFDVRGWSGTDTLNAAGGLNPVVTPRGVAVNTSEGQTSTAVATFTDAGTSVATNYTASINWGNNPPSTGSISASGSHLTINGTPPEEGSYTVTTTLNQGTAFSVIVASPATVADAPLTTASSALSQPQGILLNKAQVATFTDADPAGTISDFTASINWGDGATSPGTITQPNGVGTAFVITGSHTYAVAGTDTVTVTITDVGGTSAMTSFKMTVQPSLFVLDPTASGAFTVTGTTGVNVAGAIVVDSSSASAFTAKGNSLITASTIQVVGGASISGGAVVNPAPATGVAAVADPLAGLTAPAAGPNPVPEIFTSGSSTLGPGTYSQISVSGNGTSLTLSPGFYIITGGGFSVSNAASVTGTGVVIFNVADSSGAFGAVSLSSSGAINLSAPISGPYAGILIFQPGANARTISLSASSAVGLNGTIYAPGALLSLSGSSTFANPAIVDLLTVNGNGGHPLLAAGADLSSTDATGQLQRQNLNLYVDNANGYFTPALQARLQDAIRGLDALLAPYSVTISQVSNAASANLILDAGPASASGRLADGVLGNYTSSTPYGIITVIEGWNWYAGADPTGIGRGQFDFQTVVTHEFGHALGLGHSDDPASVMYDDLAAGTTRRSLSTRDLNVNTPAPAASSQEPQRSPGASVMPVFFGALLDGAVIGSAALNGLVAAASNAPLLESGAVASGTSAELSVNTSAPAASSQEPQRSPGASVTPVFFGALLGGADNGSAALNGLVAAASNAPLLESDAVASGTSAELSWSLRESAARDPGAQTLSSGGASSPIRDQSGLDDELDQRDSGPFPADVISRNFLPARAIEREGARQAALAAVLQEGALFPVAVPPLPVPVAVEERVFIRKVETASAGSAADDRPDARETCSLLAGFIVVSMLEMPPVLLERQIRDRIFAELGRRQDYNPEEAV